MQKATEIHLHLTGDLILFWVLVSVCNEASSFSSSGNSNNTVLANQTFCFLQVFVQFFEAMENHLSHCHLIVLLMGLEYRLKFILRHENII